MLKHSFAPKKEWDNATSILSRMRMSLKTLLKVGGAVISLSTRKARRFI